MGGQKVSWWLDTEVCPKSSMKVCMGTNYSLNYQTIYYLLNEY